MKKYSKGHEWVDLEGTDAILGITEYAAKQLGDITYIEVPKVGMDFIVGDEIGVVESVKAASEVFSPVSGTVTEANPVLNDDPGIINRSPEKDGWICKIENVDLVEFEELMTKEQYDKYLKSSTKK